MRRKLTKPKSTRLPAAHRGLRKLERDEPRELVQSMRYTDEQIERWERSNATTPAELEKIRNKWGLP